MFFKLLSIRSSIFLGLLFNLFITSSSFSKEPVPKLIGNYNLIVSQLPYNNIKSPFLLRRYPQIPSSIDEIASLIIHLETSLRDHNTPQSSIPLLAHRQQVLYRTLSTQNQKSKQVLVLLPPRWRHVAQLHLAARNEFLKMSNFTFPSSLPAWQIVPPESQSSLLSYYQKAQSATGIQWEVLAAINLVETGMGRISGASVANAQGPMQFLPSTWLLKGIGNGGDINDPHDSIQAAARYLVMRGGLEDIKKGLWGYNNSNYYVEAVLKYAQLLKEDPSAFKGLYHWEIHFRVKEGDLWLPVGYSSNNPIPISTYLNQFPGSAPPN